MKTETDYQKVKREFNTQLETAVKAKGGIDITTNADKPIDMLMLTNFKGVYGVDAGELIKIEASCKVPQRVKPLLTIRNMERWSLILILWEAR